MELYHTRIKTCKVRGVRLFKMRHIQDEVRGHLTVGEFGRELPFVPKRYFVTFDIPSHQTRGEHAHRRCAQFLTCVSGQCRVAVDDGRHREEFCLNHPSLGILVPPMIWASEFDHSPGSALMVFASHRYEPEDYIRDYQEFVTLADELNLEPTEP